MLTYFEGLETHDADGNIYPMFETVYTPAVTRFGD